MASVYGTQIETLTHELYVERLERCLQRLVKGEVLICRTQQFTPFAFPLVVERLREKVSTEQLSGRVGG